MFSYAYQAPFCQLWALSCMLGITGLVIQKPS